MGNTQMSRKDVNRLNSFGMAMGMLPLNHRIGYEQVFALDDAQFRHYAILVSINMSESDKEIFRTYLLRVRLITNTEFTADKHFIKQLQCHFNALLALLPGLLAEIIGIATIQVPNWVGNFYGEWIGFLHSIIPFAVLMFTALVTSFKVMNILSGNWLSKRLLKMVLPKVNRPLLRQDTKNFLLMPLPPDARTIVLPEPRDPSPPPDSPPSDVYDQEDLEDEEEEGEEEKQGEEADSVFHDVDSAPNSPIDD